MKPINRINYWEDLLSDNQFSEHQCCKKMSRLAHTSCPASNDITSLSTNEV